MLDAVVLCNGKFFCNTYPVLNILLYPYMAPETKDLIADHLLKTVYKTEGNDHNSHADGSGANGQPDDEPAE